MQDLRNIPTTFAMYYKQTTISFEKTVSDQDGEDIYAGPNSKLIEKCNIF